MEVKVDDHSLEQDIKQEEQRNKLIVTAMDTHVSLNINYTRKSLNLYGFSPEY